MDGVSLAMIPVSEMRIASHLRRALLALTKSPKLSDPTSSSPSIINLTLQAKELVCIINSNALTCINICPLSSHAPRAKIAPSGCMSVALITGSKGPLSQSSKGSAGCTS